MTKLGDRIGVCLWSTRLGNQIGIVTRLCDQIGPNLGIMSPIRSRLVPSVLELSYTEPDLDGIKWPILQGFVEHITLSLYSSS